MQRNVRHPLQGKLVPTVCKSAAIGGLPPNRFGIANRELIILKSAILDNRKLGALSAHAIIIIRNGGEAAGLSAIADDGDEVAAVAEFSELLDSDEGGSGKVRLVAKRAIQLGGMSNAFVDGQPEIGWMNDQIFLARLD